MEIFFFDSLEYFFQDDELWLVIEGQEKQVLTLDFGRFLALLSDHTQYRLTNREINFLGMMVQKTKLQTLMVL